MIPHPCPSLQEILTANYTYLHRRLARYLGCADLASEGLHEAWLRLVGLPMPAALRSPEAYVYRVACNAAMDRVRGGAAASASAGGAEAGDVLEQIADPSPGPELIAEGRSDLAALDRALQGLPRLQLAVLLALRLDELTREEVGRRYGLSPRRVDTALRQALDGCAKGMGGPLRAARRPRASVTALT